MTKKVLKFNDKQQKYTEMNAQFWNPQVNTEDLKAKADSMFRPYKPEPHRRQAEMDAYRAIPSLYR